VIGRRKLIVVAAVVGIAVAAISVAAGQPQRSLDKTEWIVFSGLRDSAGTEQLFRISPSGEGLRQLTNGSLPSEAPAFSPNGGRIAFARLGAGIFSMYPDGTGLRRLTTNPRDAFPTWSPNGRQIAFIRPFKTGWKLYVMAASGAGERALPKAPPAGRPSWTPHGLFIPTEGDLARIDPTSGRVVKFYGAFIDASVGLSSTAVAPGGSSITFVGSRAPNPGDKDCGEGVPCPKFALYLESLSPTKKPKILVKDAGVGAYSRDGKNVAYVIRNQLVIRSLKSGTEKELTTEHVSPTSSAPPAWR
jgi:dipeptidyl aminopeptidase/acylaminoacyl peptidase